VAAYPFTTLHPVVGTIEYAEYRSLRVADIPGLIAGAHRGVGLGHEFLRHIERTRFLVLLIDLAGREGDAPADVYFSLLRELEMYNPDLVGRPRLVVANKLDLPEAREHLPEFVRRTGVNPIPISAQTGEGVEQLRQALCEILLGDGKDPHGPDHAQIENPPGDGDGHGTGVRG
jgi:GTP-binding protein